jgi:hypothetical protein
MGSRFDKPYRLLSTLLGNKEPLPGDIVWHKEQGAMYDLMKERLR